MIALLRDYVVSIPWEQTRQLDDKYVVLVNPVFRDLQQLDKFVIPT